MVRRHANLTAWNRTNAADRDAKHADERERLYRAGWVVLRRNGYANAGITEILGEAGLGTRAFYRHFAPRTNCWCRCSPTTPPRRRTVSPSRSIAAGSPLDRLHAWIDEILALGDDPRHSEAARMFISPTMPGVFDEAGNEAIAAMRAPLRAALADGADVGRLPRLRPRSRRGHDPRHRLAAVHRCHQRPGHHGPRRRPRPRRTIRPPRPRHATGHDPLAHGIASAHIDLQKDRECTPMSWSTAEVTEAGATTR